MSETIGRVQLNTDQNAAEPVDEEHAVVEQLLRRLEADPDTDLNALIQEYKNLFYLKNLFYGRETIVTALDIGRTDRVLEVGSGCGAVTGKLCEAAGLVTCVDMSSDRSRVNAIRHKNLDNLGILVGDYAGISASLTEKYNVITMLGTPEENRVYKGFSWDLRMYIDTFGKNLAEGGCMYLALDNKLGMRYLSGGKRETDRQYFQAINTNDNTRYTKHDIERIVEECGYTVDRWIYPYPDHILPRTFYTDDRLPKRGELSEQIQDFESNHLYLFSEGDLYNELIDAGIYDAFATSFLVRIRKAA